MPTKLVNLKIKHVAGVDRPANKRRFLIVKQEKEEPPTEPKGPTMLTKEQIAKIKDKDALEAVMAQQEEMLELEKKVKGLEEQASGEKKEDDSIWKGIPPAVRNRFDAMQKERDEMQAAAKREKDEREVGNWVQKVSKFKYLQITPEHFGKVMKKAAESAGTEADEIMRILAAADSLIEKGAVFMEYGRTRNDANGTNLGDATNIVARVQSLAQDYRHLDKNLTEPQAIEKVFKDHPEWYPVYKKHSQIVTSGD
jgi:cell division septum initiation protein DivIVA